MKPYIVNAINASILIIVGLLGYFGSETPSVTALIPVFAGVILLLMFKGMKDENKVIAHIVVTLTLLVFIALFKPLAGSIARNNTGAIIRVLIMILTNLIALVIYIKNFMDVRKNRKVR